MIYGASCHFIFAISLNAGLLVHSLSPFGVGMLSDFLVYSFLERTATGRLLICGLREEPVTSIQSRQFFQTPGILAAGQSVPSTRRVGAAKSSNPPEEFSSIGRTRSVVSVWKDATNIEAQPAPEWWSLKMKRKIIGSAVINEYNRPSLRQTCEIVIQ